MRSILVCLSFIKVYFSFITICQYQSLYSVKVSGKIHVTITINEAAKYYNTEESKRKNKAEYILLSHYFRH